jgi:hypothetical protein
VRRGRGDINLKAQIAFFKQKLPNEQKVSRASKIDIQKVMDKVTPLQVDRCSILFVGYEGARRRW